MSGNTLEFFVKMKDMMSGGLVKLAQNAHNTFTKMESGAVGVGNKVNSVFARIKESIRAATSELTNFHRAENSSSHGGGFGSRLMRGAGSLLPILGIAGGVFAGEQLLEHSLHRVHELHIAEAGLKNTLENMGTYSSERFEKIIEDSGKLSKHMNFSKAEIIDLQSQLRLVGNIGESEMVRLTQASADMASKFHMGLEESGNAIAKAVNNPEMLRRLAMQLKIDPATVRHLQELAKNGQEAQARMELLSIVEAKVAGASKAAFDADPIAKFNKGVENLQLNLGQKVLPVANKVVDVFNSIVDSLGSWLGESDKLSTKLIQEHGEITSLVGMVTNLNEGNQMRRDLLHDLVEKYPELFGKIDIEKVKNNELLDTLAKVNEQYEKRISLATSDELINMYKKQGDEAQKEMIRWSTMHELAMRNDKASQEAALSLRTWGERLSFVGLDDMRNYNAGTTWGEGTKGNVDYLRKKEAEERARKADKDILQLLDDVKPLMNTIKSVKDKNEALILYNRVLGNMGHENMQDVDRLKKLSGFSTPANIKSSTNTSTNTPSDSGSVASNITSGGPKKIDIHIGKVQIAENYQLHASHSDEVVKDLEPKLQELMIKILNSGSNIQDN